MEISEFFTWEMACTYAGAVLMTTVITQFVKQIKWLENIPTQLISYAIALLCLIGGQVFVMHNLNVETGLLCAINAIVVASAANGAYNNLTNLDIKG